MRLIESAPVHTPFWVSGSKYPRYPKLRYTILTFELDQSDIKRLSFWQKFKKKPYQFKLLYAPSGIFIWAVDYPPMYLKHLYPKDIKLVDDGDVILSKELHLELIMLMS